MSVEDETWDRPICEFCKKTIPYGAKHKHANGICIKCSCGNLLSQNSQFTLWCDKCIAHNLKSAEALFSACQKQHRGAGGDAICICGGSYACSALGLIKLALTTKSEELRNETVKLFGWEWN